MSIITEQRGLLTCEIEGERCAFVGTMKYNGYQVGGFNGSSVADVQKQFHTIADYIDAGGIVRDGILLTGYFREPYKGDVMTIDGEALGSWFMDEMESSYFTLTGKTEIEFEAPSPWLLHDSIIEWFEGSQAV